MANYITEQFVTSNVPTLDLGAYSSATISGMIDQASRRVDTFIGYTLVVEDISNEKSATIVNAAGDIVVYPRKRPILSVDSMSLSYGTTSIELTITSDGSSVLEIPSRGDQVIYPHHDFQLLSSTFINPLSAVRDASDMQAVISYRAGYTTIPADIQEATLLYFLDVVGKRNNLGGEKRITQGAVSIEYVTENGGKSGHVLDAEMILMPYKIKF